MLLRKTNQLQSQKLLSDQTVVERVFDGETELFEILLRRYNELLYRTIRSYFDQESEIEDIMQDAYAKTYQKLYQFKNESTFSTWVVRIGINEALQRKRKLKSHRTIALDQERSVLQIADTSAMNPENNTIYKESTAFLENAVDTLPQKYKIVYILREVEGMEIQEISKSLDLTPSNVKVRLFRARKMIKDSIFTATNTKNIFEFGNHKCDRLVELVLKRIEDMEESKPIGHYHNRFDSLLSMPQKNELYKIYPAISRFLSSHRFRVVLKSSSMNKLLFVLLSLNITLVFGQSKSEIYRFSKDILSEIDKDTTAWKYQMGATELSFNGYYREVLQTWDKIDIRKQKDTEEDSLYFTGSNKVIAKEYIIEQSKNVQIIIINEAHHISKHRTFTKSLLKGLYDNGYRHLGLEALFDRTINERKFPVLESGYYTKEPEFGNLISEALEIGFTLFAYEASNGKNGKEREIEQAENIQKYIENNPKGKVLVHCGYAHAYENDYPSWGKAMAGRLKENMKIDPLTINQTMFLERSNKDNNHLFVRLNNSREPIILIEENGHIFNGKSEIKQTDIVIIHPQTNYINHRPDWVSKGKEIYTIPLSKIEKHQHLLVLAYRNNEFESNGIPADIVEITDSAPTSELYLSKGDYTIVMKDRNYNIVEEYNIEIE